MAEALPRLRTDLDFLPSPVPEQPGLLLRDPFRYTPAVLVIPPVLVPSLILFDGEHTILDLQAELCRRTGQLVGREVIESFVRTLRQQGMLHTDEFYHMRETRQAEFRDAPLRQAVHAGSGYANEPTALRRELSEYFGKCSIPAADRNDICGLAAPHVSPFGGWQSYAAAYRDLTPAICDKTFVLLGTSHYGRPETFGLTRKPFVTPLGTLMVDTDAVNFLAKRGGPAVVMEDYCHSMEHSIEFQCIFLQHILGSDFRILPILCGPFAESQQTGISPEHNPAVAQFFDALAEWAEKHRSRLFWILGVDLAHIGRRYGDTFSAQAEQGKMLHIRQRDLKRLEHLCAGDRPGFYELMGPREDKLRWCGYSPLYTFLHANPQARGNLVHYEQWNIDPESVVTFAALQFHQT